MRYEVRDGDSRFELDREEPLKEGDTFTQFTMTTGCGAFCRESGEFDAIVEIEHVGGPGQSGH